MSTTIENKQVRAEERRQRKRVRVERRRADRALVPVGVAQWLGIQVSPS